MCQLCAIKQELARWPKPVEVMKPGLGLLVEHAHDEHELWERFKKQSPPSSPYNTILEVCRLLKTLIESIDEEREKWWTSPAKREQRQRWELEGERQKIQDLHKINNITHENIRNMETTLGKVSRRCRVCGFWMTDVDSMSSGTWA